MANQHNFPLIGQAFLGTKILSASIILSGTDSGKCFSNAQATTNITVTLPQAKPGYTFQFLEVAAHNIVVTPQPTDNIRALSAGTAFTLNTVGELLSLECVNAGTWEVVNIPAAVGGVILVPVTSVVGTTNEIAVSTTAGVATVSFSPNLVVPAPPSGVALTVNGAAAQIGVFNGIAGNAYFDYQRASVLIGRVGSADSIVVSGASTDFALSAPGGGLNFATGGSSVSRMTINSSGNVSIAAPASGSPITVNGGSFLQNDVTGTVGLALNATGTNFGQIYTVGTTQQWALGAGPNNVTAGNKALTWADGAGSAPLVQVVAAGTGTSVFSGAGRATLQLNGSSDSLLDFSINGSSRGYLFGANTTFDMNTPSGNPIRFQTGNTTKMSISSAGVVDVTSGNLTLAGVAAFGSGTFTGTLSGFASPPSGTFNYTTAGGICTLYLISGVTGTSNVATMSLSGLPAAIQPAHAAAIRCTVFNNGTTTTGLATTVAAGSTIVFSVESSGAFGGFTTTLGKGLSSGFCITYPLN